jgi:hypothetical protein
MMAIRYYTLHLRESTPGNADNGRVGCSAGGFR